VKPLVCEILMLRGGQRKNKNKTNEKNCGFFFPPLLFRRLIQELRNYKVRTILPTLENNWLKIAANLDLW